jgi:hypothetical protein
MPTYYNQVVGWVWAGVVRMGDRSRSDLGCACVCGVGLGGGGTEAGCVGGALQLAGRHGACKTLDAHLLQPGGCGCVCLGGVGVYNRGLSGSQGGGSRRKWGPARVLTPLVCPHN